MSYSYSTLRPYQIEAVRTGKGHLSSAHELRNLFAETQNEVYLAAAERIESLERQLRRADKHASDLAWERDARNGNIQGMN